MTASGVHLGVAAQLAMGCAARASHSAGVFHRQLVPSWDMQMISPLALKLTGMVTPPLGGMHCHRTATRGEQIE